MGTWAASSHTLAEQRPSNIYIYIYIYIYIVDRLPDAFTASVSESNTDDELRWIRWRPRPVSERRQFKHDCLIADDKNTAAAAVTEYSGQRACEAWNSSLPTPCYRINLCLWYFMHGSFALNISNVTRHSSFVTAGIFAIIAHRVIESPLSVTGS